MYFCFSIVLYAYEQCLLCYSHCAEIWYEAALYLQKASETGVSGFIFSSKLMSSLRATVCDINTLFQNTQFKERWAEEAAMLYNRATTLSLPNSLLLHFAFADFEEVYIYMYVYIYVHVYILMAVGSLF